MRKLLFAAVAVLIAEAGFIVPVYAQEQRINIDRAALISVTDSAIAAKRAADSAWVEQQVVKILLALPELMLKSAKRGEPRTYVYVDRVFFDGSERLGLMALERVGAIVEQQGFRAAFHLCYGKPF